MNRSLPVRLIARPFPSHGIHWKRTTLPRPTQYFQTGEAIYSESLIFSKLVSGSEIAAASAMLFAFGSSVSGPLMPMLTEFLIAMNARFSRLCEARRNLDRFLSERGRQRTDEDNYRERYGVAFRRLPNLPSWKGRTKVSTDESNALRDCLQHRRSTLQCASSSSD